MENNTKTCSKCKQEKPLEMFYNSKIYGKTHQCKSCDAEYRKKREQGLIKPVRRALEDKIGEITHLRDDLYVKKEYYRNTIISRYFKYHPCSVCDTKILVGTENMKSQKNFFCPDCKGKKGMFSAKGIKLKTSGHVLVYRPEHPNAKKNYVPEHRLVVEESIGRHLTTNEVVHHIDCIKSNNNIDNLYLTTQSGHTIAHNSLNNCVKPLLECGIMYFENGIYKVNENLIAEFTRRTR